MKEKEEEKAEETQTSTRRLFVNDVAIHYVYTNC